MGIRTKSKPQSDIHLRCSSSSEGRGLEGSGEKKSSRLNPFHCGSLLGDKEGVENAELPAIITVPAARLVLLMKSRRFCELLVFITFSVVWII